MSGSFFFKLPMGISSIYNAKISLKTIFFQFKHMYSSKMILNPLFDLIYQPKVISKGEIMTLFLKIYSCNYSIKKSIVAINPFELKNIN